MFARFKTQHLIFITVIGALMFLADWFIAAPITAATGISGMGGLFSTLGWTIFVAIGAITLKRFPSITLMHFVYGFLTIFAPITSLPGVLKILVFVLMGLTTESVIVLFSYKKFSYYLGFLIGHAFFLIATYLLYLLLGIPAIEELNNAKYLIVIIPLITLLITQLGTFFSFKIFDKLKSKYIFKQLQS